MRRADDLNRHPCSPSLGARLADLRQEHWRHPNVRRGGPFQDRASWCGDFSASRRAYRAFLIYTLQRHEQVQRGFGPAASVELGASGGARQDRRRLAKPETPFVRVDELGGQISGNAWRAFTLTKPASSARSASAASSIWRRPLRLLGKDEVCRDDRICRQSKCQKVDESGFPDEGKNFPDRPI